MTPERRRNRIRLGAAVVILAVVIGAGVFATSLFGTAATQSQTNTAINSTAASCSPTNDLAAPRHFAFNIAVNYTGKWGATVTGYSGVATPAFVDCYTGTGAGFIYLSDWNQGGMATLHVVAEKTDSGGGNLSISMTFGSSNSTTLTNSTSLPHGSAMIAATMLGEAAIVSSGTVTASVPVESQLYDVTFRQSGACSPLAYVAPWSVTLGNETVAEPSNATLPIPGGPYLAGPQYQGLSTIVFSVPNGIYQYSLAPSGAFAQAAGSVTVNGSDVSIEVNGPVLSCATTH
jgi:hypothetical protein